MPFNSKDKNKFLPLRRFAVSGLYDAAYLSLLVQRKTLKAKKIGRNYFTTRAWFEEYLDKHARDEIRTAYNNNYKLQITNYKFDSDKIKTENRKIKLANKSNLRLSNRLDFFSWKKIAAALFTAAAILIMVFYIIRLINPTVSNEQGIVAGVEEKNDLVNSK